MNKLSFESFQKNLSKYLEEVVKFGKSFTVETDKGNVVVLSESDYSGLKETLYLNSQKGLVDRILEGSKEDPSQMKEWDLKDL